jgi:glutaredoxin
VCRLELTIFTRSQCPLCEQAKQQLHILQKEISFRLIEKDISSSEDLTEQYGLMIPVVEFEGEIVAYGKVHLFDIKQRLQRKISTI